MYTVATKNGMNIVGIELRTTNDRGESAQTIPAFWQYFFSKNMLEKIPHKVDQNVYYAIYTDYDDEAVATNAQSGWYSMILGTEVTAVENQDVPEGMVHKIIPPATYALFKAKGPVSTSVLKTWHDIWSDQDLQRSFTFDMEVYDTRYMNQYPEVDIYVSIK